MNNFSPSLGNLTNRNGLSPLILNLGGGGDLLGGGLLGGGGNPFSMSGLQGGLYGLGGNVLQNALGIQSNPLGLAGGILGNFSPLGPLGGAIGGFLGNTLGSAFGLGSSLPPRARANFVYDFATGNPYKKGSKVYDDNALKYISGLTDYVGDTAKSTLDLLGIAPSASKFGFGSFQGRTGFALDTDPFVRDINSPGAYNAIGPSSPGQAQALQMGRVFGNLGDRTNAPQQELFTQAAQAALDTLVRDSITKAGLTNAQVFGKLGLPTDQGGFQSLLGQLPDFQFGQNFDFNAPSQFTFGDIMAAQQLGQSGILNNLSAPALTDTDFLSQSLGLDAQRLADPSYASPDFLSSLANILRSRSLLGGLL